jgi:hypothetical protein
VRFQALGSESKGPRPVPRFGRGARSFPSVHNGRSRSNCRPTLIPVIQTDLTVANPSSTSHTDQRATPTSVLEITRTGALMNTILDSILRGDGGESTEGGSHPRKAALVPGPHDGASPPDFQDSGEHAQGPR